MPMEERRPEQRRDLPREVKRMAVRKACDILDWRRVRATEEAVAAEAVAAALKGNLGTVDYETMLDYVTNLVPEAKKELGIKPRLGRPRQQPGLPDANLLAARARSKYIDAINEVPGRFRTRRGLAVKLKRPQAEVDSFIYQNRDIAELLIDGLDVFDPKFLSRR